MVDRFVGVVVGRFERNLEQLAGKRQAGPASRASQQTVMPDAVEPAQQDVEQEPLDERVGGECHDPLPLGAVAAIILVAKGDAFLVERDQPPVRDRDPVGLARQIGEDRLWSREGWLGIDHPALLPHGRQEARERPPFGERRDAPAMRSGSLQICGALSDGLNELAVGRELKVQRSRWAPNIEPFE